MFVAVILAVLGGQAQIGYQVALMDQSTGKLRANETVTATVTITDNGGAVVCNSTQSATTNEFGMLSLQVGDASSFNDVDWTKLPLWVSASVGGITIGKSQILNVPVAEHAKHWGALTIERLTGKSWRWSKADQYVSMSFSSDGSGSRYYIADDIPETNSFSYTVQGNIVFVEIAGTGIVLVYDPLKNAMIDTIHGYLLR